MKSSRVELREANAFVGLHHRHHKPATGHRFSVGAEKGGKLVGVAICGRPVARGNDQKYTLEVLRCCTDGTSNACSFLYAVCSRVAKELGFTKIGTYILDSETGKTLLAAGWEAGHTTSGGSWNSGGRQGRREDQPQCPKTYWFKTL